MDSPLVSFAPEVRRIPARIRLGILRPELRHRGVFRGFALLRAKFLEPGKSERKARIDFLAFARLPHAYNRVRHRQ